MAVLKWNRVIGQERVKGVIGQAFQNGTLGHAYLFCGERGTGKFAAAVDLAMALLCRHNETRPCGICPACRKVNSYSHPDFHVIMPLVLQSEHKKDGGSLTDEGWAFAASATKRRLDDPYRLPQYSGITNIPVDWIREAKDAIMRGGTEAPATATIIDGVESMNKESANAMLKTLEEPPPGTIMILLTDKLHAVPQTIVSRCQIMRFALLPPDVIRAELYRRVRAGTAGEQPEAAEPEDNAEIDTVVAGDDIALDLFGGADDLFGAGGGGRDAAPADGSGVDTGVSVNAGVSGDEPATPDPRVEAAAMSGSIGLAIEEFEDSRDEYYRTAAALWNGCLRDGWEAATQAAEGIAAGDDALMACRKTLVCLIQLLRLAFFHRFGAPINYFTLGESYKIELPETVTPNDVERFVKLCQDALNAFEARGNTSLVMVNFACTLMEMLNGEEQ